MKKLIFVLLIAIQAQAQTFDFDCGPEDGWYESTKYQSGTHYVLIESKTMSTTIMKTRKKVYTGTIPSEDIWEECKIEFSWDYGCGNCGPFVYYKYDPEIGWIFVNENRSTWYLTNKIDEPPVDIPDC